MAEFLWACWDGGGNLTPSLGIARALDDMTLDSTEPGDRRVVVGQGARPCSDP